MTLDLIIISHAKTSELKAITQRGINTALDNNLSVNIRPIVIEGNQNVQYHDASMYYQSGEFNYNRFLNLGASISNSEYICFANNDLIYGDSWASKLITALESEKLDSVSPYSHISQKTHNSPYLPDTGIHRGLTVKHEFEGWCFLWRRSLWNEIKLDERISFWCSDDATVEQLKQAGKSHALVSYANVEHPHNGGQTLKTVPNRKELTIEQAKIFNRLYDKNIENAGK
jgi:GT2 family glycosyltransferase